jgi:hypothetical protein
MTLVQLLNTLEGSPQNILDYVLRQGLLTQVEDIAETSFHELKKHPEHILKVESVVQRYDRVSWVKLENGNFINNQLLLKFIVGLHVFQAAYLLVRQAPYFEYF